MAEIWVEEYKNFKKDSRELIITNKGKRLKHRRIIKQTPEQLKPPCYSF